MSETPMPNPNPDPTQVPEDIREQLAAIEHERWADWQKYVHSLMGTMGNQNVIDSAYILRWEEQISTPYADLTEAEKQSDRDQVDRYWPLLEQAINQAHAQGEREGRIAELMEFQDRTLHQAFSSSPMDYVKFHAENANYISDRLAALKEQQHDGV